MLKKVSADDVSSYQSYAIRRLDQWRSIVPDSEQYKPLNRKEDAISNKLKYLNTVLSDSVSEWQVWWSHLRKVPMSASESAKSRLSNKDGRFCKHDQYISLLLQRVKSQ